MLYLLIMLHWFLNKKPTDLVWRTQHPRNKLREVFASFFCVDVYADIDAHDEYGKTPLHCAVGAQKLDIVHCLLRYKPDVDAHDDRDDTALHTATRTGNFDIVLVSFSTSESVF